MAGNREKAIKGLLMELGWLDKTKENVAYWKKKLEAMSDAEMDQLVDDIDSGQFFFSVVVPNFKNLSLSVEELMEIGEKMGHKFLEHVWLTDKTTGICYLSNDPYLIIDMMCRRQSQTLLNKIGLSTDNSSIDTLSGQVTGDSKSSRLSFVELQILNFSGCDRTIEELAKPRGGDRAAAANLEKQILDTGVGSLDAPGMQTGSVKSVDTQGAIFTAMHLDHNFNKKD